MEGEGKEKEWLGEERRRGERKGEGRGREEGGKEGLSTCLYVKSCSISLAEYKKLHTVTELSTSNAVKQRQ
jgi:predicted transposase YdaD